MIRHLLVAGVLAGAVLAPVPAYATTPPPGWKTYNYSYSKSYCFTSSPLHRAMKVTLSGKVRYKRHSYKFNRGIRTTFHDPTLINPKATLKTYTKCSNGTAKSVSKASIDQIWYDWKCKTSVSVFVGIPWQAGIGATRSCGSTKRAHRSTGYGKGSSFTQNNSGAPVRWDWGSDGKVIDEGGKICLHADGAATAWVGNTSDMVSRALDVCVPASYK